MLTGVLVLRPIPPKYVLDTHRFVARDLRLNATVLRSPFGYRLRVLIEPNRGVLRELNWATQEGEPRILPEYAQKVGAMPYAEDFRRVAGALKQKIVAAGTLKSQKRGVKVALLITEDGKPYEYQVLFPRNPPKLR